MALFGRKKTAAHEEPAPFEEPSEVAEAVPGPRDSEGDPAPAGYVDLGALYVPTVPGMQLRAQFEADKTTLRRILLVTGTSGIQVSVVAAPRSGGLWPELSEQITTSITREGGQVEVVSGRYGEELQARIAVRLPNGSQGFSPVRIIGIEGPRWLARLDIQGAGAAGDQEQLQACYDIIDKLIVHRGKEPRVRLEMLPLRLPKEVVTSHGAA